MDTQTAVTQTLDAPTTPAPTAPVVETPVSAPGGAGDPFALDESRLASLTPEQRASLTPMFDDWKKRASAEIEKSGKSAEERYKPLTEKATALDHLVKNPAFQKWWTDQQQTAMTGKPQDVQGAIQGTKPQDFATPDEWSTAVIDASNGNPAKLQEIQQRMFSMMSTPLVRQFQEKQQLLETTMEMKNLFERHPDAKQLDEIGRNLTDPNDRTPSLLEIAMYHAVDQQGKSIEEGYQMAKRWSDSMGAKAKQQAMGLVQEKKDSVTANSSTSAPSQAVVEVADRDELMQKHMEAVLSGIKPPRFVIRK